MKILISGGTGFLGSRLAQEFNENYEIHILTRKDSRDKDFLYINKIDYKQNYDVIINFSGEPLDSKRWNEKQKSRIYDSRINSTKYLVDYINASNKPPKLFMNGSAVGYYGTSDSLDFDESSSPVKGTFAQKLCDDVEKEASKLNRAQTRLVHLRTGVVLDVEKGALPKMALPFKFGLGAILGEGSQYLSWIHIKDYIAAIIYIIERENISGPINLTSPNPERNKNFSRILAECINKPLFLKMPSFVVNLLFGEMANEILLNGQKVLPKKLLETGFKFSFDKLRNALNDIYKIRIMKLKSFLFTVICLFLPSCSDNQIEEYAGREPKIDIREFFNGKLEGYGIINDRSGVMTSSFDLKIDANWNNDIGIVDEVFTFNDGRVLNRSWNIDYKGNGLYEANAEDLKGVALGRQAGNAINTKYKLLVPFGKSKISLTADDWVYKINDRNYISRIYLSKFGFKASELTIYLKKID